MQSPCTQMSWLIKLLSSHSASLIHAARNHWPSVSPPTLFIPRLCCGLCLVLLIKVYWCSLALVIYFIPLAVQRWEMQIDKLLVKGAKTAKVHSKQKNIIWLGLRRRPVRWVFINSLIYSFKELRRIDINNAYTENNHEIKIEGFQKARFKTVK